MGKNKSFIVLWMCCVIAVPLGLRAATPADAVHKYDIVIAGAGTGGTSAAIEAARLGARVALLEETDWIGGQASAAAVSTMDEGDNLTPPSGLYREFLSRLDAYYLARGKSVATCYWQDNSHCFEPSAVRKILGEMITEINSNATSKGHIDLYLQDRVVRVLSDGNTVTGVVTKRGLTLQSKILIDATEYGDVLPLTSAGSQRPVHRR
jgi:flavin-dependent dehydrogenase